ncbi:MAG: CPBP family intramembrane metalloprotease [Lachnospiraceae bacterium]|nr:CPBP family intramembrane metalloprotease [Lachnospiraceae bacterium]
MGEYKSYRKAFSRLGLRYVLGTVILYAVNILGQIIIMKAAPPLLNDVNMLLIYSMVVTYLVGMPVIYLLVRKMPVMQPQYHKMSAGQFVLAAIMCFSLMYCSNLIGTVITTLIGIIKGSVVETNAASQVAMTADMRLTFIFMVLCAPVIEEFIFRKLIVDRTVKYGEGTAVLLSGLMFGLFHGNLSQFVYAFTLGMFLAFIYVRTGKLKITVGLHMIVNFMGGIVSVLILKMLENSELYDMIYEDYDPAALGNYIMSGEGGGMISSLLVLLVYSGIIVGAVITGIILFIVFRKSFVLRSGEITLDRGRRFRTVILNPGMLLYCLFWFAMIIYQLIFG